MEKFQLSTLFEIQGIGSASGILLHEDLLYIISDNSSFLYQYDIKNLNLTKVALVENCKENIPKKDKLDLEAIALKDNKLHIFGSGSTENRNKKFTYDTITSKIEEENLEPVYKFIKHNLNITDDELNIEGALYKDEILYLFQRGNGCDNKNGIIILDREAQFFPIALPKIKNVRATFTDAILIDDKIYFLAAAEDTTSTYDDGEVLGSIIGCLTIETLKIDFTFQISNKNKFEGLTLYKKTATQIELLLCEDNDSEELMSTIFLLKLPF